MICKCCSKSETILNLIYKTEQLIWINPIFDGVESVNGRKQERIVLNKQEGQRDVLLNPSFQLNQKSILVTDVGGLHT